MKNLVISAALGGMLVSIGFLIGSRSKPKESAISEPANPPVMEYTFVGGDSNVALNNLKGLAAKGWEPIQMSQDGSYVTILLKRGK